MATATYGETMRWEPATPRLGLVRTIVSWGVATASVAVAAWIVPGVGRGDGRGVSRGGDDRRPERRRAADPGLAAAAVHARWGSCSC